MYNEIRKPPVERIGGHYWTLESAMPLTSGNLAAVIKQLRRVKKERMRALKNPVTAAFEQRRLTDLENESRANFRVSR